MGSERTSLWSRLHDAKLKQRVSIILLVGGFILVPITIWLYNILAPWVSVYTVDKTHEVQVLSDNGAVMTVILGENRYYYPSELNISSDEDLARAVMENKASSEVPEGAYPHRSKAMVTYFLEIFLITVGGFSYAYWKMKEFSIRDKLAGQTFLQVQARWHRGIRGGRRTFSCLPLGH